MILLLLHIAITTATTAQHHHSDLISYSMLMSSPPQNINTNKHKSNVKRDYLISIQLNGSSIYPYQARENGCFGSRHMQVNYSDRLVVKADGPFLLFFMTQTYDQYYHFYSQPKQNQDQMLINRIIQSTKKDQLHLVQLPLTMTCNFIGDVQPHMKMRGRARVDFESSYSPGTEISFDFLVVCAPQKSVDNFSRYYVYIYIFFFVGANLCLMIYTGYNRNNGDFVLFIVYLLCSSMFQTLVYSYILMLVLFLVVVLKQRKQGRLNNIVFSIYITLAFIVGFYLFLVWLGNWNGLFIVLNNFVVTHFSMFMVLRLIKLQRLRHVFWYFVLIAVLSFLYQGGRNLLFQIRLQNVFDLSCIQKQVFFPLMMLPIANYFTSMTWWMHRVIALFIAMGCVLPVWWGIKMIGLVLVGVLVFQIRKKGLEAIKHRY